MMSLINTNYNYLDTMGISEEDPLVGVIVSVYYLGCAVGAVFFSWWSDKYGRKKGIFLTLATASLGNLIMFLAGLGFSGMKPAPLAVMFVGRIIMGLGVGGVDSVIPVYSSELASDETRGKAMAQEFQSNILGLNMAFGLNLGVTAALGKQSQWAWRIPIIAMQVYPVLLLVFVGRLPESPRWFVFHERSEDAKSALVDIYGKEDADQQHKELEESHEQEADKPVSYMNMVQHPSSLPRSLSHHTICNTLTETYSSRLATRSSIPPSSP